MPNRRHKNDFDCSMFLYSSMSFHPKKTLIVSQTDENNCLPNPCHNGGKCIDGINDYTCECVAGYLGKNCSVGECVGVNPSLTYPF